MIAHYCFQMEWSFHLGYLTNTICTYGFETPHNIEIPLYNSLGRCLTHPLNKPSHPPWHKTLFVLATELFKFIISDYVQKQYMIHFSKMSVDDHNVPLHVNCHDIGPQYLLLLEDWEGAELKSYNCTNDKKVGKDQSLFPSFSFSTSKQILKLNGRLAHEMIQTNFSGVRYTVIAYQLWHEDKTKPEPLFYPPVPIHSHFQNNKAKNFSQIVLRFSNLFYLLLVKRGCKNVGQ